MVKILVAKLKRSNLNDHIPNLNDRVPNHLEKCRLDLAKQI